MSLVLSYRGLGCWMPGEIFHAEFYLFIKDIVFPNSLKSSVVSISLPYDQIIAT